MDAPVGVVTGTDFEKDKDGHTVVIPGQVESNEESGGETALPRATDYTVMIYMCGSDLESGSGAATQDLASIINSCYSDTKVNVVVLAGGTKDWKNTYMDENDGKVSMYQIVPQDAKTSSVDPDNTNMCKIASYGNMNMGKPETLAGFMNFVAENYPSDHTGLILWNHGGGVNGGVCFDENYPNDSLTIRELQEGFANTSYYGDGKKLDWISCDACLMSNFEVALKLSPYGAYYIASEEVEMGGWDYNFLKELSDKSNTAMNDTKTICARIAQMYVDKKKDKPDSYIMEQDLNVIDLQQAESVANEVQTMEKELITYAQSTEGKDMWLSKFVDARNDTPRFGDNNESSDAYDLVDFKALVDNLIDQEVKADRMAVISARLDEASADTLIPAHYNTGFEDSKNLNGVSIYFPYFAQYATTYSNYNVIPSWTVLMEKFAKEYKRTTGDVDLRETVKEYSYNVEKKEYIVSIKDEYWNYFMDNIAGIEVAKVRQALDDGEPACVVNAITEFIPCPLYRINEAKKQISYRMNDMRAKPDNLVMMNHMPVALLDENEEKYVGFDANVWVADDNDPNQMKLINGVIKCYLNAGWNIEVTKLTFTEKLDDQSDGEEQIYEPGTEEYLDFVASVESVKPFLQIVEQMENTDEDANNEIWQEKAELILGVEMQLPEPESQEEVSGDVSAVRDFLFINTYDTLDLSGKAYTYDGIVMRLTNRAGNKQLLSLYKIWDDYDSYSSKIMNLYADKSAVASLFSLKDTVSGNSVSQNSVSQNSVSQNSISENAVEEPENQEDEEKESTAETISDNKPEQEKPDSSTEGQSVSQNNVISIISDQSLLEDAS